MLILEVVRKIGSRAVSPDETRRSVMAAAQRLFVRKGYFNTSIPDLVAESGVSIGSIYHHFSSKQSLAGLLYEETMNSFAAALEARIGEGEELEPKLRAVVTVILEMADRNPVQMEYMIFVKHEEIQPDSIPICMSKPFRLIEDLLRSGVEQGAVKALPVEMLAAAVVGIPLKLFEMKLRGVITYPLGERSAEVFALCWDAVRA